MLVKLRQAGGGAIPHQPLRRNGVEQGPATHVLFRPEEVHAASEERQLDWKARSSTFASGIGFFPPLLPEKVTRGVAEERLRGVLAPLEGAAADDRDGNPVQLAHDGL